MRRPWSMMIVALSAAAALAVGLGAQTAAGPSEPAYAEQTVLDPG